MTEPVPDTTTDAEAAPDADAPADDHADDDAVADEDTDDEEQPDGDQDGDNPNAEAIKWRRQFRAAQADLAALTARMEMQQQAVVDGICEARRVPPKLLALEGYELDAFLDERSLVDQAKVAEAAELVAHRNRIGRPPKANRQQGAASAVFGGSTWAQVLHGD